MNKRKLSILICVMLVVICLLTFSFIACDKPAGEGGDNPNNNIVDSSDNNKPANKDLTSYIDSNKGFINTQLSANQLVGYEAKIVDMKDLSLINKAIDKKKLEESNKAKDQNEKDRINEVFETQKNNVRQLFEKTGLNGIVYVKGDDVVVDLGIIYVPFKVYETYCEYYLALTNPQYHLHKETNISNISNSLVKKVVIMDNIAFNSEASIIIDNVPQGYEFFDMLEDREGNFIYKKNSNILVKYKGTDKTVVTVPKETTVIEQEAFKGHTEIERIIINNKSLTKIGDYAFDGIPDLDVKFYNDISNLIMSPETGQEYSSIGWKKSSNIFSIIYKAWDNEYHTMLGGIDKNINLGYETIATRYYGSKYECEGKCGNYREDTKAFIKKYNITNKKLEVAFSQNDRNIIKYMEKNAKANNWSNESIELAKRNIKKILEGDIQVFITFDKDGNPDGILDNMIGLGLNNEAENCKKAYFLDKVCTIENFDITSEAANNLYQDNIDNLYVIGQNLVDYSKEKYPIEFYGKFLYNYQTNDYVIMDKVMGYDEEGNSIDNAGSISYYSAIKVKNLNYENICNELIVNCANIELPYIQSFDKNAKLNLDLLKTINDVNFDAIRNLNIKFPGKNDIVVISEYISSIDEISKDLTENGDKKVILYGKNDRQYFEFKNGQKLDIDRDTSFIENTIYNNSSVMENDITYRVDNYNVIHILDMQLQDFQMHTGLNYFNGIVGYWDMVEAIQNGIIIVDINISREGTDYQYYQNKIIYSKNGYESAAKTFYGKNYNPVEGQDYLKINDNTIIIIKYSNGNCVQFAPIGVYCKIFNTEGSTGPEVNK